MMNTQDHLLVVAIEEAVEVAKRLSKILRFGPNDVEPGQQYTALQRAQGEIYDLIAAFQDLNENGIVPIPMDKLAELAVSSKRLKVQYMLEHSRNVGRLSDEETHHVPQEPSS